MASLTHEWSEIYRRLDLDRGDRVAYAALQRRVHAMARPALSRCGWQIVEDVVEDTCSAVVVSLEKARGPDTFRGFVVGTYLNTRRFYLEQRHASTSLEGIDVADTMPSNPEHDELALLRQCVDQLPPRERTAVLLRFIEDAPYRLIAEALKVTENNARQIVHAATVRLRACARSLWPKGRG